ncbi:carbohydrate ABC transporter permease [Alteribacillus sp. HJP-4]|uniref:carbohydrate ABC transporter permease n=1 Tax=Alteribacillus sp. HJP-4 TaxID=2775394 RepID=UPI0035CCCAD5
MKLIDLVLRKFHDYSFILPAIVFLSLFLIYPVLYNINLSFRDITIRNLIQGDQLFIGMDNYTTVLTDPLFIKALTNSLLFTLATLVLSTFFGFCLALFFNQPFPGHKWMRAVLLVAWMTPIIITGTIFKWMLDAEYGIINEMLLNAGLISEPVRWLSDTGTSLISVIIANVWLSIPFSMVILLGGLQGLPKSVYEAARIDGANKLKQFIYITFPMMKPTLSILIMLGVIYTFKVFDVIYIMTAGGPANSSQVVPYLAYDLSFTLHRFGEGAALSNISLLIIASISLLYLYLIRKESVID